MLFEVSSLFCHTHIVAVQIQDSDGDEMVDKVRDLSDQVPAQVQFVDFAQLLDALWHRGDLLEAEVQAAFAVKGQLHAALSHFQGDCLTFGCLFVFLSLGHPGCCRERQSSDQVCS